MWAKIFANGNVYLIEEPGSKAVAMKESFRETVKLADTLNWAKAQGAGMFAFAPAGEAEPLISPKPQEPVLLKVTRTTKTDAVGCIELVATFKNAPGEPTMKMRSGLPGSYQKFRKPSDPQCLPGSCEPLPQGRYLVGDIEFAGNRDDYTASHGDAYGPVIVELTPKFSMRRAGFLIHLDGNVPGTAGCLSVATISQLKELVGLLRKYDPKELDVDWGL
jgi:lysozyme